MPLGIFCERKLGDVVCQSHPGAVPLFSFVSMSITMYVIRDRHDYLFVFIFRPIFFFF